MECSLSKVPLASRQADVSPGPSAASMSSSGATPSPGPALDAASPPTPAPGNIRTLNTRPKPSNTYPSSPSSAGEKTPGAVLSSPRPALTAAAESEAASPASAASTDPFPYLAKFVTSSPEQDTTHWVVDLELLHQFITSTYTTFTVDVSRKDTEQLWQVVVPQLAFAHVFLLHQILAISARHLAHLYPQRGQEYSLRASQHQSLSFGGMRGALANISPHNCHALFAASSLLFISSLAALAAGQPVVEGPGPSVEDLADIFLLMKGVGSVLHSSNALLRSGPLARIFMRVAADQASMTMTRVTHALNAFSLQADEIDHTDAAGPIIRAEINHLATAIRESATQTESPEYRTVAVWPLLMSDALIPLLRQRNQAALALLCYYCVMFHAAELQGYWFMQGWASSVLADISKTLSPPWNQHLTWALAYISEQTNKN